MLVQGVTDYAIYMLDPEGLITKWNAGAQRIKGYTEAEVLGTHFSRFYTPDDQASGQPARALSTASTEGRFEQEGWRVRKDGSRFLATSSSTASTTMTGGLSALPRSPATSLSDRRQPRR